MKRKPPSPTKIAQLMDMADHLEMRANDPWPDELWPAANVVLTQIADELRQIARGQSGAPE